MCSPVREVLHRTVLTQYHFFAITPYRNYVSAITRTVLHIWHEILILNVYFCVSFLQKARICRKPSQVSAPESFLDLKKQTHELRQSFCCLKIAGLACSIDQVCVLPFSWLELGILHSLKPLLCCLIPLLWVCRCGNHLSCQNDTLERIVDMSTLHSSQGPALSSMSKCIWACENHGENGGRPLPWLEQRRESSGAP